MNVLRPNHICRNIYSLLRCHRLYHMSTNDRTEAYSGIVAFANNEDGFRGILKQRYTDFVVREIDSSGAIAQLSTLSGKELQARSFPEKEKPSVASEALADFMHSLRALISVDEEREKEMFEFLSMASARHDNCPNELIVYGSMDKPTRSRVHQLFKAKFNGVVDSDTIQVDGVSSIRIQPSHKLKRGWNNRARDDWPAGLPNHLKFVVAKENCDTATAVSVLSKHFRCSIDCIKYAGTKDKRGVTFQYMTTYRRRPSDVTSLNRFQFPPTIRAGNFQYVDEQLSLGDLSGNRFEITLREVSVGNEALEKMCTALKHSGFINYFGLQRFGNGGTPNQDIGLAIFRGNWKTALDLIFTNKPGERSEIAAMKSFYAAANYNEAIKICPRYMSIERSILDHLCNNPNDFAGAIGTVPKASSLMWAHAYQSHIWNKAVTFRIQQFGLEVMEGDLIGTGKLQDDCAEEGDSRDTSLMQSDSFSRVSTMEQSEIIVVTNDDVISKRYSIEDVILPLPGSTIVLPTNSVAAFYEGLLEADGISLMYFKDQAPQQFRMKGTYRRIVQSAHDLQWDIKRYVDPDDEINTTELKEFDQVKPSKKRSRDESNDAPVSDDVPNKIPRAESISAVSAITSELALPPTALSASVSPIAVTTERIALSLRFSLPPGTYATMLLRELTKQSMETQFHSVMTSAVALSSKL